MPTLYPPKDFVVYIDRETLALKRQHRYATFLSTYYELHTDRAGGVKYFNTTYQVSSNPHWEPITLEDAARILPALSIGNGVGGLLDYIEHILESEEGFSK